MSRGASGPPADLVRLCRVAGRRVPEWVQGPGGNLSVKADGPGGPVLWVKATGWRLDEVGPRGGLVGLRLDPLREALARIPPGPGHEARYARVVAGAARWWAAPGSAAGARPSMEVGLHALLPRRWVIHLHSLAAVLMAERHAREPDAVEAWLAGHPGWRVAFAGPLRPGWALAGAARGREAVDAVVLAAHGVALHLDDAAGLAAWAALERDFARRFGYPSIARRPAGPRRSPPVPPVAPLRAVLPDVAVFRTRLLRVLEPAGGGPGGPAWTLRAGAREADRDAVEIFEAVARLHAACPDLAPLPDAVAGGVAAMAAERWRRKVGGGR